MLLVRMTGDTNRLPRYKCTYRPCAIRHSAFRTSSEIWQRINHEKAGKIGWPPDKNEVHEALKVFKVWEFAARQKDVLNHPKCTAFRLRAAGEIFDSWFFRADINL
jgi:hypothetical protein